MKSEKLIIRIPDQYYNGKVFHAPEDFVRGLKEYLRDQGKTCELLGFNVKSLPVVLIDGVKYYGKVGGNYEMGYFATLFVVDNAELDYI